MHGREAREGRGELRIVIRERAIDERGGGGALLDEQRGAVRGRHGEEEEGARAGGVERLDLDGPRGQPERASFEVGKPACSKSRVMSFLWKSACVTLVWIVAFSGLITARSRRGAYPAVRVADVVDADPDCE